MDTKDIYFMIGKNLAKKDFYSLDVSRQKELVEVELVSYIGTKLEIDIKDSLEEMVNSINLAKYDSKEMTKLFADSTHCVLNIAGEMQSYTIPWFIEDVSFPTADFDEVRWASITTSEEDISKKSLLFTWDIFKNHFMTTKKERDKINVRY